MKQTVILFTFIFQFFIANAATHEVEVSSNNFSPSSLTDVKVGDIIKWTLMSGSHTTTSTSVPSGAATWDYTFSGTGDTFEYTITEAGTYSYECTFHSGMTGSFTVTDGTVAVDEAEQAGFSVYPTTFNGQLNVKHPRGTSMTIFDSNGKLLYKNEEIRSEALEISTVAYKKGIYFLRFENAKGEIYTRRLIKL